jgi:hypothetical protein
MLIPREGMMPGLVANQLVCHGDFSLAAGSCLAGNTRRTHFTHRRDDHVTHSSHSINRLPHVFRLPHVGNIMARPPWWPALKPLMNDTYQAQYIWAAWHKSQQALPEMAAEHASLTIVSC